MAYDPTTVPASIVVSGVDLRQACGFEALSVDGRYGLTLERREYSAPTRNGTISHGGRFRPPVIRVSGWMPRARVHELRLALMRDVAVPSHSARMKYIQFFDDPDVMYVFDTVVSFSTSPVAARNWGIQEDIRVNFDIAVVDAVGRFQAPASYGMDDRIVVGPASHRFIVATARDGKPASFFDRAKIRLRTSETTRLVSAERGVIHDFDRTLTARSIFADLSDVSFLMYAPENLLLDGEFDDGDHSSWGATGCTKAAVTFVEFTNPSTSQAERNRVLTGEYALELSSVGVGDKVSQAVALQDGFDYVLRVEVFLDARMDLTVRVKDGLGATLATRTIGGIGVGDEWIFDELVFTANANNNHTVEIECASTAGASKFWLNRVVLAESILGNGNLEAAASAPFTTGANCTVALDNTVVRTGTYALKATSTAAYGYFHTGTLVHDANTLYYISGWARRISGNGDLIVCTGNVTTNANPAVACRLSTGDWVRFSTFYFASTANEQIGLALDADATVVHFDDVAVTKLYDRSQAPLLAKGGIHFEPGAFGFRLQVPIGECLYTGDPVVPDAAAANPSGLAFHCQFFPMMGPKVGGGLLAAAIGSGTSNFASLAYDLEGTCGVYGGVNTGAPASLSVAKSPSTTIQPMVTPPRGALGACLRYDGIGATGTDGLVVGVEAPKDGQAGDPSFDQALSAATAVPKASGTTFGALLLGDGVAWDGFWITQYPPSDIQLLSEMLAAALPPMRNRWLILGTDHYFIDLEAWTIETYDHDGATYAERLVNAWPDVAGDMLRFYGEHAVLFFDKNVPMIQMQTERSP
jgi:hypothetical protein